MNKPYESNPAATPAKPGDATQPGKDFTQAKDDTQDDTKDDAKAPRTAAKGDDQVMSQPANRP